MSNSETDCYYKIEEINQPYRKIVFADDKFYCGKLDITYPAQFPGSYCVGVPMKFHQGIGNGIRPSIRHNIGSNYSFADGHCEMWDWKGALFIESSTKILTEYQMAWIVNKSEDYNRLRKAMTK